MEILKGRGGGGSRLWNSVGMGGNAFWNFRRQGGLKHGSRPLLGMDIFWNYPIEKRKQYCISSVRILYSKEVLYSK